jgi:hypothetical protein
VPGKSQKDPFLTPVAGAQPKGVAHKKTTAPDLGVVSRHRNPFAALRTSLHEPLSHFVRSRRFNHFVTAITSGRDPEMGTSSPEKSIKEGVRCPQI